VSTLSIPDYIIINIFPPLNVNEHFPLMKQIVNNYQKTPYFLKRKKIPNQLLNSQLPVLFRDCDIGKNVW